MHLRRFPIILSSTPLPYNTNSSHGNDTQKIKFLLIFNNIFESQELLNRWKGAEGLIKAGPETVLHMSLGPLILIYAGWIDSDANFYSSQAGKGSGVR